MPYRLFLRHRLRATWPVLIRRLNVRRLHPRQSRPDRVSDRGFGMAPAPQADGVADGSLGSSRNMFTFCSSLRKTRNPPRVNCCDDGLMAAIQSFAGLGVCFRYGSFSQDDLEKRPGWRCPLCLSSARFSALASYLIGKTPNALYKIGMCDVVLMHRQHVVDLCIEQITHHLHGFLRF